MHEPVADEYLGDEFWGALSRDGVQAAIARLGEGEAAALSERFGTRNYHPLPVTIVRASGAHAFGADGTRYIDCVGAYSALAHGHLNPAVVEALKAQLEVVALTSRAFSTKELALFCAGLAAYAGADMVCPMNTGSEAVETCIKLARKWGYARKGVPRDRAEIIVAEGNFHGRTTTIVGFSSEARYRDDFGPYGPGFKLVPFGDLDALRAAIGPETVAFMAEPIQAEGGIVIPPDGYLASVRRLCDEAGILLVWDEVQTGFCRTGKPFAWMHEAARPDLMAVGKPLGGGLMPVSAAVGARHVMELFEPGDHGSTFGGSPLACAVALMAIAEMETCGYAERSARLGARLRDGLLGLGSPRVADVRGRGLLVGLEVGPDVDGEALTARFLAQGLLTKETRARTFRFAPPLMIDEALVDEIVERAGAALA